MIVKIVPRVIRSSDHDRSHGRFRKAKSALRVFKDIRESIEDSKEFLFIFFFLEIEGESPVHLI